MEENAKVVLDWVHLPAGVKAASLWAELHDARLYFVASDRLARTAMLKFEVFYLEGDTTVVFQLESVTSLRATRVLHWPGPYKRPDGISYAEECRLVAEYQAKGRAESLDWAELEAALGTANLGAAADDKNYLDVSAAYLVQSDTETTLHLQGFLQSTDLWHEVFLHSGRLNVARNDGGEFSLDQLTTLGEAWWNDFSEERSD